MTSLYWISPQEAVSILRHHLTGIGIPIIKIRQLWDHLIFTMVISMPEKTIFILRLSQGPGWGWWWQAHDDVIKWKHFPRNWPFVRGIHRSPVNSLHKGQWPGALMFSLICVWIMIWVNNREAGDLRPYRTHYDVIVMECGFIMLQLTMFHCVMLYWITVKPVCSDHLYDKMNYLWLIQ